MRYVQEWTAYAHGNPCAPTLWLIIDEAEFNSEVWTPVDEDRGLLTPVFTKVAANTPHCGFEPLWYPAV